jgi:hypothetical protein
MHCLEDETCPHCKVIYHHNFSKKTKNSAELTVKNRGLYKTIRYKTYPKYVLLHLFKVDDDVTLSEIEETIKFPNSRFVNFIIHNIILQRKTYQLVGCITMDGCAVQKVQQVS